MKTKETIVPEPQNTLAGHGYTLGQILEIGEIQKKAIEGNATIPLVDANNGSSESIQDQYFKQEFAGYKVSKFDAINYHVVQEKRLFDPYTGVRISKASVQIYNPVMFEFMVSNDGFAGMLTHILHNPSQKIGGVIPKGSKVKIVKPD